MTACVSACDASGCSGPANSMMLLKKLDSMIADNYTLLFVLVVIIVIIGLSMLYFINSLKTTLSVWWKNKSERAAGTLDSLASDNPRSKGDDNNNYYIDPRDDPESTDPFKYAPSSKLAYVKEMDAELSDYNQKKTEYIQEIFNKSNDDKVDRSVMYKDYDDYKY